MQSDPPSNSAPSAGSAPARARPLDWPRVAGKVEPVAHAIEVYVRQQRRRRAGVIAAALAAVVVAGVTWRATLSAPAVLSAASPATNTIVSLPARQTLSDGSVVDLKPGAEIAVRFTSSASTQRRVVLTRGEAHFTVTKDPQRPFIVEAGGVEVRAVGTAFSVQRGGAAVAVLVTEGRVALDKSAAESTPAPVRSANQLTAVGAAVADAPPPLAFVDAGSRAVVPTGGAAGTAEVQPVSAAELTEHLAWRVPRLEFNATPIAEVVAMFNRHAMEQSGGRRIRLILADRELETLPLSGVLRADNIAVLLQIVESSYGIRAERQASGEIVLRRAR